MEGRETFLDKPLKLDPQASDPIWRAAQVSYDFVRIHPYSDGNGRPSRLLMNLMMWGGHPPVYLKADKKGRHRYLQSLRRADRGDLEPLACLVAVAVRDVHDRLLLAVDPSDRRENGRHTQQ